MYDGEEQGLPFDYLSNEDGQPSLNEQFEDATCYYQEAENYS